ncbi:UV radiation resistance-associated protein-like [Branchiostoma floridae]|uniref:UV radiation resistance-associated protein-like n=1 Tax=Branchiostoma floridae TaxID=7739 RepID=A0A9J7M3Q7_BRAFL|nr:UV radiation resistance-associated protein-like [Branchiostoma floridae]
MATRDARYRVIHPDHSLQQRRLRHLRSVSARNIVAPPQSAHGWRGRLLDTYFTLCTTCDQGPNNREFYRSEVIRKSLNPIWKSFELRSLQDGIDTSITSFIVQLWGGTEEKYSLLIEWKVNLGGLRYIGPHVTQDGHGQSPNTIIFGMFEGYYTAPDHNMERSQENQANASRQRALQQDHLSPRQSYNGFSLLRVHTTQRAIKQTQMAVSRIQEAIDDRMEQQRIKAQLDPKMVSERETLRLRVALLHEELRKQTTSLQMEQETSKNERKTRQQRESELEMKREGLAQAKLDLGERMKGHIEKRLFTPGISQIGQESGNVGMNCSLTVDPHTHLQCLFKEADCSIMITLAYCLFMVANCFPVITQFTPGISQIGQESGNVGMNCSLTMDPNTHLQCLVKEADCSTLITMADVSNPQDVK